MSTQNLSEILFKPRSSIQETSTVVRRPEKGAIKGSWYRVLPKPTWIWAGSDIIEINEVLARVVKGQGLRSYENLLDTVVNYSQGNWIFEWAGQAHHWQEEARALPNSDSELAGRYWLRSALCFSIASYPHLCGDKYAGQAAVLAHKAAENAFSLLPYERREITFTIDNKPLTGTLYVPDGTKGYNPTVLVCGGLNSLESDYATFYIKHLAPAGFAMLCIDMPSVGYSAKWKLSSDTSYLHHEVLKQLVNVAWVDHHNVFALGHSFGGNAAIRLGYLEPNLLKGVISIDGLVHHAWVDPHLREQLPDMYKDLFVSRLKLADVSEAMLFTELKQFSLKNQGLLGKRCKVPALAMSLGDNFMHVKEDAKFIASSFRNSELLMVPANTMVSRLPELMRDMVKWMQAQMA